MRPWHLTLSNILYDLCNVIGGSGRVELHGFLNAYGLGRSPLSEKFLTGSAQLRQLFGTDTDVYVSKDAFIECLQKNPLLIALFAACVNDP
ncbi:hypothetical protein B296_00033464 [Ensete ventricosum]|uniref:Uncharacterized protein n=1 Tax=Ensete ventricosum TaxID=4639 RepID=A0A426ZH12_ENSVE|nr:hypothetical protein B296_00033464 [Ensete ventricosum]